MRARSIFGWFVVASLVGVVWLVFRQRELTRLHADSDMLRRRIAALEAPAGSPASKSNSVLSHLSSSEKLELLRLRGEVGVLRDELQTHRSGAPSQVRRTPAGPDIAKTSASGLNPAVHAFLTGAESREAHQLAQAVSRYIKDHGGVVPEDFASLSASDGTQLPSSVSGRFEAMATNRIPQEARSYTLVARERAARAAGEGQWFRVYVYADEAVAVSGPVSDLDWSKWEQSHPAFRKKVAEEKATGANQR